MAVFSTILVINHIVETVNKQQAQLIERQTNTINSSYNLFLQHRLTLLTKQASFPIMIQTAMQPSTNMGRLRDSMADMTLLGEQHQQALLDFEGNPLYSTLNTEIPHYKSKAWLKNLLEQQETSYIGIEELNKQHFWCIAVAIRYNDAIEGLLVTLIPIEAIAESSQITEHSSGLMIELRHKDKIITRFGEQITGQSHIINWPKMSTAFEFTFDNSIMKQELYSATLKFSALIIIALIFISFLAYRYGYHYFVQPLLRLSQVTTELNKGHDYTQLQENLKIKELDELFIKFNQMTQKVHQREQALKKSYDELSKANEELVLSESQLIQSEKMASIGVLAAGVAHEINNPIGYIKSNLTVFQDYLESINDYCQEIAEQCTTQEQKDYQQALANKHDLQYILEDSGPLIENSIDGVEKVAEIVRNLKTFARAEEDVKTLTDINEGLNATINMVANELKYNCQLHIDLSPLPKIYAFPSKLNQVFMNLLINAGQSIADKGDIFIRTYQDDNALVVEVKDTGTGISPENLPHIFTPFFTSKPVGEGTGLGLSISHSIIEQHSGKILINSTIGKGSCFSVYIPLALKA